jgi:uncharacterized protein (TIGR02001 family)
MVQPARLISLFFVMSLSTSPVVAAEVTGYALLTTDFVYRGVSHSDEHGAAQVGVDLVLESGLYFGVWGSTIDIGGGTTRQRDREINYYLGYSYDISRRWTIGVNAVAYAFPGAMGQIDYDYEEYSVSVNYDDRLWLEYGQSPDLYHTGAETEFASLYTSWPLGRHFVLGGGVGVYDVSELVGDDYSYWELGVTRAFGKVALDIRFHDTSRWLRIISSPETADGRVVLSAKILF